MARMRHYRELRPSNGNLVGLSHRLQIANNDASTTCLIEPCSSGMCKRTLLVTFELALSADRFQECSTIAGATGPNILFS